MISPQVDDGGRKVGAGIGAQEIVVCCAGGNEKGAGVGIGDCVGRVEGVVDEFTFRG